MGQNFHGSGHTGEADASGGLRTRWNAWLQNYREKEFKAYKAKRRRRLKNTDFTILASDCNGTIMYYDLGLPFLSPTINLTIGMNDFVKMLENLPWYMAQELTELKIRDSAFPVGLLGDIRVNFVHYQTFEESAAKWEERKKRVNWDNLFFVGSAKGNCTYETIRRFDQLPYQHKVIFTHVKYPEFSSAYQLKGFEKQGELGTTTNFTNRFLKRRYLDSFDYVSFLNGEGF